MESLPQKMETEQSEDQEQLPLRYGCDDTWTWNRRERSPEVRCAKTTVYPSNVALLQVKLYGINFRTAHFHPNWSSGTAGVRGTKILNNGRYFWELHLSQRIFGTSMMFGVGTRRTRLHADAFTNLLGENRQSWGLSHKGLLWHAGRWLVKNWKNSFESPCSTHVNYILGTITRSLLEKTRPLP